MHLEAVRSNYEQKFIMPRKHHLQKEKKGSFMPGNNKDMHWTKINAPFFNLEIDAEKEQKKDAEFKTEQK